MKQLLWICLAGALGTGCRRVVGLYAPRLLGDAFPWGTFLVNIVGCFLISLVAQLAARRLVGEEVRLVLMTGFMGGLTTYSSFHLETTNLLRERAFTFGALNVVLTLAVGFAMGLLGEAVARWFTSA